MDFALPYSETGVVFVVPVRDGKEKGEWVFLKPLTKELWLLTGASFLYIGMMVWIFEYQADEDFKEQMIIDKISNVFYFSFSTLFFAHSEFFGHTKLQFLIIYTNYLKMFGKKN